VAIRIGNKPAGAAAAIATDVSFVTSMLHFVSTLCQAVGNETKR
jgi:hypothetical protein